MAVQNVRILPFINVNARITSIFWEDRGGRPHRGVDLSASGSNIPLYSMCRGRVILVANDPTGFGNYVIMKDDTTGLGFLYAHMREVSVVQNQFINIGTQIGIQGSTGSSTGNHLHLEMQDLSNRNWIFQGNRSDYINPAEWIPYNEIIDDYLYYDGETPTPTTNKRKNFPWVLYSRKLRNKY